MLPIVVGLRGDLEAFAAVRARADLAFAQGTAPSPGRERLFERFPRMGAPDAFFAVREELASAEQGTPRRRRLEILLEACAVLAESRAAARLEDERGVLETSARVRDPDGGSLTWRTAAARLAGEENRRRREGLASGVAEASGAWAGLALRRIETALETARGLGASDYIQWKSGLAGLDVAALEGEARAVLADTESAYRELLGYFLRRFELRPHPGGAAWHDVLNLFRARPLDDSYPRGWLDTALDRWAGEVGLDVREGLVRDGGDAEGKSPGPFAVALVAPGNATFGWRPSGGRLDYHAALRALGPALASSYLDADAPPEDRRFGDPGVPSAWANLFNALPRDWRWVKRYVADPPRGDERRLPALAELGALREACAQALFELDLHRRGPSRDAAEAWRTNLTAAAAADFPEALWASRLAPGLAGVFALRGRALAASLRRALLEAHDEDWWRNPRTGPWLVARFRIGGRDSPETLAKACGVPLSLTAHARALLNELR